MLLRVKVRKNKINKITKNAIIIKKKGYFTKNCPKFLKNQC